MISGPMAEEVNSLFRSDSATERRFSRRLTQRSVGASYSLVRDLLNHYIASGLNILECSALHTLACEKLSVLDGIIPNHN